MTRPRVWIGSLSDYNAGRLIGEWVDAVDLDELEAARDRVLARSEEPIAEEWFLADSEGFGRCIGEYTPLDEVARIGVLIEEHGDLFGKLVEHHDGNVAASEEALGRKIGEYDSGEHYVEELIDMGLYGTIPASIRSYIDVEAIWHDIELDGSCYTIETKDGKLHIFDAT